MTNVTVQEALKRIDNSISQLNRLINSLGGHMYAIDNQDMSDAIKLLREYKATLFEIDKFEPVAEAIRERDKLGFAVVNVIGKLDEIIENTQEAEIDDFLHIAVPVDMWNELQAELEYMPKRAELYTSPQPIEKCEPVYLIVSGADEIVVTKEKYDSWTSAKRISYTSLISKEWVELTDEQLICCYHSDPIQHSRNIAYAIKQLNTKG